MKVKSKFVRMYKVLSLAVVIFIRIYWYKIRKRPNADWERLWGEIGERFRKTLFELEGLLIKIGQILSIRSDLLPSAFISQIQDLTDKVPPSNWNEIKEILEKEWRCTINQHFRSIDETAIASASIGEVYKGVLKDGTEVAIKVQRPNIQTIVQTDFRTLRIIIWFVDHFVPIPKGFVNFTVLFRELKEVIERELDFSKELEAILYFKNRYKDNDRVKIPSVYSDLSTSKVLVMEWVEGLRLTDVEGINQLQLSRQELAQNLISIFLPQWIEAGMFHADPHPGNVHISQEGKIILLDFGMVGEISKKDATNFQGLIESILAKNYTKAVECLLQLGFLLPEAEAKTIERLLAEFLSFQPGQLKEMDLIALKLEMNDLIRALPIQVPTRFVFLGRSFVTIEGILRNLVPEEEPIDVGKPVFMEWIKGQSNKWSFIWQWVQSQPVFKVIHSVTELLNAPQKIEQLSETEQRRGFQFTIYENRKKMMVQMGLLGIVLIAAAIYTNNSDIWKLAVGLASVSTFGYFINSYKQKKWMKYMHEKRRS